MIFAESGLKKGTISGVEGFTYPVNLISFEMKKPAFIYLFVPLLFYCFLTATLMAQSNTIPASLHQFTVERISGEMESLQAYEGKVLVVVNVASKCGLTPQYEDLQRFYEEYADRGVVVLGFPANDFMGQEPGTNEQIQEFCSSNYGVSFPMFSKISVKGRNQHALYKYFEQKTGEQPGWNFHKYLVNQKGEVIASIPSRTSIYDPSVIAQIRSLLGS